MLSYLTSPSPSPCWLQRRNARSCNGLVDILTASTRHRQAPHRTVPRRRRCRRAGCATERISKVDRRHTIELARHDASRLFTEAPRVSSQELSSSWADICDPDAALPVSARELAFAHTTRQAGEIEPDLPFSTFHAVIVSQTMARYQGRLLSWSTHMRRRASSKGTAA